MCSRGCSCGSRSPTRRVRGRPAFEHHADLPQVELDRGTATVLVGELAGATSPARADTPLLGVELDLRDGTTVVPLRPDHEHALVVLRGAVGIGGLGGVGGQLVRPGALAHLGTGRDELVLDVAEPTRAVLLGGEPLRDELVMWWNFVGRSRAEIDAAYASWQEQDDRFGRVASALPRIPAPPPTWSRAG